MNIDPMYVTIPRTEYHKLLREYEILQNARAYGVDNWEGWMSWVEDDDEEESYEDIYGEDKTE